MERLKQFARMYAAPTRRLADELADSSEGR